MFGNETLRRNINDEVVTKLRHVTCTHTLTHIESIVCFSRFHLEKVFSGVVIRVSFTPPALLGYSPAKPTTDNPT